MFHFSGYRSVLIPLSWPNETPDSIWSVEYWTLFTSTRLTFECCNPRNTQLPEYFMMISSFVRSWFHNYYNYWRKKIWCIWNELCERIDQHLTIWNWIHFFSLSKNWDLAVRSFEWANENTRLTLAELSDLRLDINFAQNYYLEKADEIYVKK